VTRLIGRKRRGQVLPSRARPEHPEHALQDGARIAPRSTAAIRPTRRRLKQGREQIPLRIGQFHAPKYDARRSAVYETASSVREKTGLSQSRFAELLGVSVRTLQEWEQGRRAPSGAARTLLLIAAKNPRALLDVT
jgi:putative transcriptional regulator